MRAQESKRYWIGSLSLLAGNLAVAVVTLLATPEILETLGKDRYGLFRIGMIAFVGYMAQLQMGLGVAGRRFFADAYHDPSGRGANYILGQLFTCFSALALVAVILSAGAALWLGEWIVLEPGQPLTSDPDLLTEFRILLLGAGAWVAGMLLRMPMIGAMEALGRFDLQQVVNASSRILLYGGVVLGAHAWGNSLAVVAVVATCLSITEWILARWLVPIAFPSYRPQIGFPDTLLLRKMLRFSFYGAMGGLGGVFVYSFPEIVIAVTPSLGAAEVTHFGLAILLTTQTRALLTAFSASLFPFASMYRSEDDEAGLRDLLSQSIVRNVCIWGAVAIPLIFFSGQFLEYWVGAEYRSATILIAILSLDSLGAAIGLGPNHILIAAGSIRLVGLSQLVAAGVATSFIVVSASSTSLGLPGIALGIGITQLARGGLALPQYASSQIGGSTLTLWKRIAPGLLLYLAFCLGIASAVASIWHASTLAELLFEMAAAGCSCLLLGLLIFARNETVSFLRTLAKPGARTR